ncbi:MAG TPA: GGDEF domain-containing protein [Leucothrix sp.]|nr:GGDEF domain-containing protein [Leucothrix sp.]HIQ16112.1 GGDEF domain-containing protein [Leucothrix sp.]
MQKIRIFNRCIEIRLHIFSLAISFISIAGFGIYRISIGDFSLALIDFSISIFLAYTLKHVLYNTFTDRHKYLLILVCMLGVIGVLYNKGGAAIYWAYPPITGAFFFLGLHKALPLNILFIGTVLAILSTNTALPQFFSISITLTLICIFGYTFSVRTEYHNKKFVKLADLDPLTNLKNRRSLKEQLVKEISYHKNDIQKSSLLILDLDHFKKVNDVYGHTVGDRILVKFSKMLKSTVRETDQVYRYGGEEFIIIANNTHLVNAAKLAEHIRQVTERTITIDDKPVTVSIGVAEVRKNDTDISWLHRADHALYRAKGDERNQVYLAHGNKKNCNYRAFSKTRLSVSREEKYLIEA